MLCVSVIQEYFGANDKTETKKNGRRCTNETTHCSKAKSFNNSYLPFSRLVQLAEVPVQILNGWFSVFDQSTVLIR